MTYRIEICSRCKKEYKTKMKKDRKYKACRKCTMYLSNRNRKIEAKNKGICITCFKRKAITIKCPHCKKDIIKSPRCKICTKDNNAWELRRLKNQYAKGKLNVGEKNE